MFKSGVQILRFVKMATARISNIALDSDWLYKFTADSLKGEHLDFLFRVKNSGELPAIIRDLVDMTKNKKWWLVDLVEGSDRMLMIKTIKEPKQTQEELNEKSKVARLTIS